MGAGCCPPRAARVGRKARLVQFLVVNDLLWSNVLQDIGICFMYKRKTLELQTVLQDSLANLDTPAFFFFFGHSFHVHGSGSKCNLLSRSCVFRPNKQKTAFVKAHR